MATLKTKIIAQKSGFYKVYTWVRQGISNLFTSKLSSKGKPEIHGFPEIPTEGVNLYVSYVQVIFRGSSRRVIFQNNEGKLCLPFPSDPELVEKVNKLKEGDRVHIVGTINLVKDSEGKKKEPDIYIHVFEALS